MDAQRLQEKVREVAEEHEVPGVAVGMVVGDSELYACHGVTSLENPLPVDEETLFQFGSTGKTFTATAIMRLVEQGTIELDEPVRTYVPELKLQDEDVAEKVTVLQLLNHTAGWSGDFMEDTGNGDDALARYVELMADIAQVTPLGAEVSYNNASLSLAGRMIEKVTGSTFEQAIRDLLFEPLGLEESFFFPNEIMTRRFVAGHNQDADGTIRVARPWALPRSGAPAGGISATVRDQLRWARFHLGDGRAPDGTRVLREDLLRRMQEPTVGMRGSALGDHVGISWLLKDVDGVRIVGHGGTTNGQHSDFLMVPDRDWALVMLTNSGPNGPVFMREVRRWALAESLGVDEADPEPLHLHADALAPYAGEYESIAATCAVTPTDGGLRLAIAIRPEFAEQLREAGESAPEDPPPFLIGLLPGDDDRYVVTEGSAKGMTGFFRRDADGGVASMHVGGRLLTRV